MKIRFDSIPMGDRFISNPSNPENFEFLKSSNSLAWDLDEEVTPVMPYEIRSSTGYPGWFLEVNQTGVKSNDHGVLLFRSRELSQELLQIEVDSEVVREKSVA